MDELRLIRTHLSVSRPRLWKKFFVAGLCSLCLGALFLGLVYAVLPVGPTGYSKLENLLWTGPHRA